MITFGVKSISLKGLFWASNISLYLLASVSSYILLAESGGFDDWFLVGKKNFLALGILGGEQLIRSGICGANGIFLRETCWMLLLCSMILLSANMVFIIKIAILRWYRFYSGSKINQKLITF